MTRLLDRLLRALDRANDPPWLFAGIVALIVWMVVR